MKSTFINIRVLGTTTLALIFATSCPGIPGEQSRSIYKSTFFQTGRGVEGDITSMCTHSRYIYGQAYYYNSCLTGTNEATYVQSADGNFEDADSSGVGSLTISSGRLNVLWGTAFSNINTANGVIEDGSKVGVPDVLLAEACFFRGMDYFLLVQTLGGAPLDLGVSELKFNISTSHASVHNTVPEVYTKAVFSDLRAAVTELLDKPRVIGGVTKTVARLYLSKAYLTYGWWLGDFSNTPAYPECNRTDPDGHDAVWYYQQAYDTATEAIDSPGPYGLMESLYQVNAGPYDRNKETLLHANHTQEDEHYNGDNLTYGSGGAPDNFVGWVMNWNYTGIQAKDKDGNTISLVIRVAEQVYGRLWARMAPSHGVFIRTFKDRAKDSCYDGTFTTVYRGNRSTNGEDWTTAIGANGMGVAEGEPLLKFPSEDDPSTQYPGGAGNSNTGAGAIAGYSYYVMGLSAISRRIYPGLWKLGLYRTNSGTGAGQSNAGSIRPYNIAKFSELYLIAAEVAVKGVTTKPGKSTRELVNVLCDRVGKWIFSNVENEEMDEDYGSQLIAEIPVTIDINFILDERSREFYDEGYCWFDFVCIQEWNEHADNYKICGDNKGGCNIIIYTRAIKLGHYLRPIPQGRLDGMEMSANEKKNYQNPEYR